MIKACRSSGRPILNWKYLLYLHALSPFGKGIKVEIEDPLTIFLKAYIAKRNQTKYTSPRELLKFWL